MTFGVTHWNLGVPKPNTNKENWFVTGKTNNKVQKYRIFWYFPKEDTCSKISSNSNERLFFSAAELSAILFWNKMNKGELFSEVKVKIAGVVIRVNKWWTTYGPSLKKKKPRKPLRGERPNDGCGGDHGLPSTRCVTKEIRKPVPK